MIITVAGFKGGIGKTTTALHLAAFFAVVEKSEHVLLVDGDPRQFCTGWSERGSLPFKVCGVMAAPKASRDAEHIVIDTEGDPDKGVFKEYAEGSDLVVLPCSPDAMSLEAVLSAAGSLRELGDYGVVLTLVDSRRKSTALQARKALERVGIPVYRQSIRRLAAYEKAALEGVPVYGVNDSRAQAAWGEYTSLGREIVGNG